MTIPTSRKIHAIKLNLPGETERAVIVWLADTAKLCLRLVFRNRTWETTQAGDAVILNGNRETVESVELFRVFPASENGREVRSAWHWLRPGE